MQTAGKNGMFFADKNMLMNLINKNIKKINFILDLA